MSTQGEGRHHGVHVFFIFPNLQNIDKKYQSMCSSCDCHQVKDKDKLHQQQPSVNKDNHNNKPRTKMIDEHKVGQIRVLVVIHLQTVNFFAFLNFVLLTFQEFNFSQMNDTKHSFLSLGATFPFLPFPLSFSSCWYCSRKQEEN